MDTVICRLTLSQVAMLTSIEARKVNPALTLMRQALKAKRMAKQMDDNIDDLGRRPDGSVQEQPGGPK